MSLNVATACLHEEAGGFSRRERPMATGHRWHFVLLFSLLLLGSHADVVRTDADHAGATQAVGSTFQFPAALRGLDFVENRGQWVTSARFVARRGDRAVLLEDRSIQVYHAQAPDLSMRLTFEGASPATV